MPSQPAVPTSAPVRGSFYGLLDQLRALAALAVVWAHLVGYYMSVTGATWLPAAAVDKVVERPVGVIHDFGWFGVAVFFFISGFVITHAAFREGSTEFAVKRLLRIYPPLLAAVLIAIAAGAILGVPATRLDGAPLTLLDVAANATLLNHVVLADAYILTVAWTLAVEVAFYALMWALHPLTRRAPWATALVIIAVSTLASLLLPDEGWTGRIAQILTFLPLLVMGQALYLTVTRRVPLLLGLALGGAGWVAFVACLGAVYPERTTVDNNYAANAAVAFLLVVIAVLAEGRFPATRVLAVVAKRSYSLYLVHGPLGLNVMGRLDDTGWPYPVVLLIALLVIAVVTEAVYRFVERPSIALGKASARRLRARTARRLAARKGIAEPAY